MDLWGDQAMAEHRAYLSARFIEARMVDDLRAAADERALAIVLGRPKEAWTDDMRIMIDDLKAAP